MRDGLGQDSISVSTLSVINHSAKADFVLGQLRKRVMESGVVLSHVREKGRRNAGVSRQHNLTFNLVTNCIF